jgi:hypothetical protein
MTEQDVSFAARDCATPIETLGNRRKTSCDGVSDTRNAIQADGIVGDRAFDLTACLRARETSTRLLILALRETDPDKLRRSEATWASADRLWAKVKAGGN